MTVLHTRPDFLFGGYVFRAFFDSLNKNRNTQTESRAKSSEKANALLWIGRDEKWIRFIVHRYVTLSVAVKIT